MKFGTMTYIGPYNSSAVKISNFWKFKMVAPTVLKITKNVISIGVRGEIDLGGHGHAFLTRLGWSPRGRRRSRSPANAEGATPMGSFPRKFWKIDCWKRIFQAFQALCSHYERVCNSKETAGRTGFLTNADMLDNLLMRRHPQPIPYPKKSSLNDWSRGLLLQQNRLSFPTRAVLPDSGRRDDTLPPAPFPKIPQQMVVLAISSFFHFFVFLLNFFGARAPRTSPCSYTYGDISAAVWPMFAKFVTLMQNGCQCPWPLKIWISIIQDGGWSPFWKQLNRHISTTNRPILKKKLTTVTHTCPLNLT